MKSDVSSAVRRSAAEHVTERVTCLLKTSSSSVELSVCTFKVKVDAHNEAYVDGSCYFSQQNWVLLPQFNTFAWILILKKSLRGGYRLATLTEDTQFQGLCVARKRVSEVIGLWGRVGQKELVSVQSQIFWSIGSQSRFWRHSWHRQQPGLPLSPQQHAADNRSKWIFMHSSVATAWLCRPGENSAAELRGRVRQQF